MWDSVLLSREFGYSLLRSAILSGDIRLITPESTDEREQLRLLTEPINRSKSQQSALTFALLADTLYVDGIPWEIFFDLSANGDLVSRPLIEVATPEFSCFVKPTDSALTYSRTIAWKTDPSERANLFASLEPLIWKSFKKSGFKLNRNSLRKILDLIVVQPDIIKFYQEGNARRFTTSIAAAAGHLWPYAKLSRPQFIQLGDLVRITITKGQVAANAMGEAQRLNAIYPVRSLSFGRNRYLNSSPHFPAGHSEDIMVAVGIFLDEIKYWPRLNDFSDVLRLRENKNFIEFRNILRQWVKAVTKGDKKAERKLRAEIQRANSSLSTSIKCVKTGRFFTYLGLPLIFLDILFAPLFGAPFTVTGFALQAFSDWEKRRHKWLLIGE